MSDVYMTDDATQIANSYRDAAKGITQGTTAAVNGYVRISNISDQNLNRSFDLSLDGINVMETSQYTLSKIDASVDETAKAMILPAPHIETLSSKAASIEITRSVTKRRKDELLIAARKERIRWIMEASLPYERSFSRLSPSEDGRDKTDSRVSLISASHVSTNMPTLFSTLGTLYGAGEENKFSDTVIGDRIEGLLGKSLMNDKELTLPDGKQVLNREIEAAGKSKTDESDVTNKFSILKSYQRFLSKLKEPACVSVVQGMKTFCLSMQSMQNLEDVVSTLKAYFPTTILTLKSHTVWTNKSGSVTNTELSPTEEREVLRSLESFIYAHCNQHIRSLIMTDDENDKNTKLTEKIKSLSFVEPRHLEIKCLEDNSLDLSTILETPIEQLLSVDQYYSVFEKLQRILALYRSVNSALSTALNQNHISASDHKPPQQRRLPSADDILPTIIFVVIRAQPRNLMLNLKMIEDFSPIEYLRGEAGYAYTNLYGAVQFILELNLDEEPKRLCITENEYRDALNRCKDSAQQKFHKLKNTSDESASSLKFHVPMLNRIPAMAIRVARQNGEVIDTNWANRWYEENDATTLGPIEPLDRVAIPNTDEAVDNIPQPLPVEYSLPSGFHRNYSFLATRPEDIRLADLPLLLDEYRMLVQTVETLLSEKAAEVNKARKANTMDKEKRVLAAAQEVDPSLLPASPSKTTAISNESSTI